jgi:hypothetical protein
MTGAFRVGIFVVSVFIAGCRSQSAPALLFDCRLPNGSDRTPSAAAGLKAARTFARVSDFLAVQSGARYAFVVPRTRELVVSTQQNPAWPEHATLGRGEPVLAAGGLTTLHDGRTVQKVIVDAESAVYCPTAESVREAVALVMAAGVPGDRVRVENRVYSCIEGAGSMTAARDYGDVMVEIERRFQLAGEAIARKDADTADYYLYALYRSFAEDLSRSHPPETRPRQALDTFAQTFIRTDFPELRQAVWDEDWPRARAAFERGAATCNACHEAANVKFLVVRSPFAPRGAGVRPADAAR